MSEPKSPNTTSDNELRQRYTGSERKAIVMGDVAQADAELATKFGYNPVFKREFGYLATFSFAVSISGLFSTIMTTFSYPLEAGGSSSVVWSWLISGAGCMCIAVGEGSLMLEKIGIDFIH
jgi:hypothetical protein